MRISLERIRITFSRNKNTIISKFFMKPFLKNLTHDTGKIFVCKFYFNGND